MSRLAHVMTAVLALCLTVSVAQAENQLALVQSTFDALRQSATALQQGDSKRAMALLANIQTSADKLRITTEKFRKQAEEAEKLRQAEAIAVVNQITQTYQAEQAAEKKVGDLKSKLTGLQAQLDKINPIILTLEQQAISYRKEVEKRQWCTTQFANGFFSDGDCFRWSWQDLGGRVNELNNNIRDYNTQRANVETARHDLNRQIFDENKNLNETKVLKANLEVQRQRLEQQAKMLRAAVVSLSDASIYWADTTTLIKSSIFSIETLQQNLQLLVRRATKSSAAPVPVFDSYDREQISSLEETLINFAKTIDNNTNFLQRPENVVLPAPPRCPPQPVSVSVNDATLAAGRARGAWSKTKPEDWQNWIDAARCVSPAAIYYGKFPNAQECENRCIADPACTIWSYNAMYQGKTNPVWADSLHECWGGLSTLKPIKAPPKWGGFLSGGIR